MRNYIEITNKEHLIEFVKEFKRVAPDVLFFDTETDGIHIKNNKPFLIQCGFRINKTEYCIIECDREKDPELFKQTILTMFKLGEKCKYICGHNVKFDLHMLSNLGYEYSGTNVTDTMIRIRAAHDALTQENGGPPLALKEYCAIYVDRNAKTHEHKLAEQRKSIAKEYNLKLKNALYKLDKRWTIAYVNDYFKDVLNSVATLPDDIRTAYLEWYQQLPEQIKENMTTGKIDSSDIPYNLLDRETVMEYAAYDIIYTAQVYYRTAEAIEARDTWEQVIREEAVLLPCWRMERCGFQMNKPYIVQSTMEMAKYLKEQRDKLKALVGFEISVNANPTVKKLLNEVFKIPAPSTGKEALARLYDELKAKEPDNQAVKFIGLVQELRTLEKWYVTYLLRFVKEMKHGDRIYTQINQVGTVSGRVTSDFQQFPKYGIMKDDETPLFNPRDMITSTPGYKGIAYLDYSQIELRLQAMYTILVDSPDLNLCRAYMPFKCHRSFDHKPYDYNNINDIKTAYTDKWLRDEDELDWTPTDVHAATTHVAFPDVDMSTPEFKKLRGKVGKRVNFAKNYGAQFNRIKQMFPDYDDETIHRIDDAYYTAFPGVKKYHEYCYNISKLQANVPNLFGVCYYGLSGHKLINCLIQGSGAYFLKQKICELDKFILDNKLKSRMQMQIHDEISFEIFPGEEQYVKEFKRIMEDYPDTLVPIVAELEFTTTTWGKKEECDEI